MDATPYRYDQVSYPTGAFEDSHPRRLATLAALYGMPSPPIASARVLELGCGRGGNILPMAYALPTASFTGIDLAPTEIAAGVATAQRYGLRNLSLRHLDICTVDQSLGQFDYILAHGVYSWVPPAVQERLLWICGNLLSPTGVAYVSYNAMPGGLFRQVLRDMLRYDGRQEPDPQLRIQRARSFSRFVAEAATAQDPLLRSLLSKERDRIARLADPILFHDDLADFHEALYLHQFVARAEQHGLRYLADASFESMHGHHLPAAAQRALSQIPDRVEAEQYLDFFSRRVFRRTLLCRATAPLFDRPQPAAVAAMSAVSYALVTSASSDAAPSPPLSQAQLIEQLRSDQPLRFKNPGGVAVGLGEPLAKAALFCLGAVSPQALPFAELLSAVQQLLAVAGVALPTAGPDDLLAGELRELLLTLYSGDMIELSCAPPPIAAQPGALPQASPLARDQVGPATTVVNLWHRNVLIDHPVGQRLLPLLDGQRDRAALLAALAAQPAAPAVDATALESALQRLTQLALIEPASPAAPSR